MKVKLYLGERIALLGILPAEANFVTLRVLRDLKQQIGIKEEEFKKYDIVQEGDKIRWGEKGLEEVEFEIGEKAEEIITDALKELDRTKKLHETHMSLYEKFVKAK